MIIALSWWRGLRFFCDPWLKFFSGSNLARQVYEEKTDEMAVPCYWVHQLWQAASLGEGNSESKP
jgi:hypothetical protein